MLRKFLGKKFTTTEENLLLLDKKGKLPSIYVIDYIYVKPFHCRCRNRCNGLNVHRGLHGPKACGPKQLTIDD